MAVFPGDLSSRLNLNVVNDEIHRIVLTEFMGAGKSTVGLLLAGQTGWDFIDLDTRMETATNRNARALFDALGETGFRQLESDFWAASLQQMRTVIARGGAVIDETANQRVLAKSAGSFVVFLDAPFQTLIDRCLREEQQVGATYRPLLHKIEIAQARYIKRRVLYTNHAHRVIDVSDKSPESVAQDIWQAIIATH